MRVVFVENRDSFSFNVIDLLPVEPIVVSAGEALVAMENADVVVVGPGPMDPERAGLIPLVRRAAELRKPYLGICLGHQALGVAFGAALIRSEPAHGKVQRATFASHRWSPGLNGVRDVMRYHSLSLKQVVAPLEVTATLEDGTVMAIAHATLPMVGLQFHPDSHGTPNGAEFINAFFVGAAQ